MRNSMLVLVASFTLVACSVSSNKSSVASETQERIAECITDLPQDNMAITFTQDTKSKEIYSTLLSIDAEGNKHLVRNLNVCSNEDHGSIITTVCHDVNFTDTYTVTLERSGWVLEGSALLSFSSRVNPFDARKMSCSVLKN